MTRGSFSNEGKDVRYYNSSSSESSFSSEIDVESLSDSYVDGLELVLDGKSEAQQKFKRLRRIFLNRPTKTKKKENTQTQKRLLKSLNRSRRPSKTVTEQRESGECQQSCISSDSSVPDERATNRLSKSLIRSSARPLQAAIEQHINALREQMKRHSAHRDSSKSTVETSISFITARELALISCQA